MLRARWCNSNGFIVTHAAMTTLMRIIAVAVLGAVASASHAADAPSWLQSQLAGAQWVQQVPGIERLAVPTALEGSFAAYRLAQDKVTARVLGPMERTGSSAEDVAMASKAVITVNGGYFWIKPDGALAPTGLLMVDGAKQGRLNKCRACTALLFTDAKGLHIVRPAAFAGRRGVVSALQVGPMLVDAGKVMAFNPDGPAAPRTAVCLSGDSIVVLVVLGSLTLHDLAALLLAKRAEGGFDCAQAINFDGGSSSQLAADLPGLRDRLGYATHVQNFLAFFPR